MRILLISDIHGNLTAMQACMNIIKKTDTEGWVILGDAVDYGPHSNEIINTISQPDIPIICCISGNHEQAVTDGDYSRFSSERGKKCAANTKACLSENSKEFIRTRMNPAGIEEFTLGSKRCLAVHGSIDDPLWGTISAGEASDKYSGYDFVFSGHSHIPHYFETYYSCDDPSKRNRKKTVFVNPGSVGQPRNHCPCAQFAVLDTETEDIHFYKVPYDVADEQKCFSEAVDEFYSRRLELGV